MTLVELVTKVGDDAIELQNVTNDLVNARIVGKRGNQCLHITFATRLGLVDLGALATGGKGEYTGLVLWIKTADIDKAKALAVAEGK